MDKEVESLINKADQKRKEEDLLSKVISQNNEEEEKKQQKENEESECKYGHLSWLNKLIDLNQAINQDVLLEKKVGSLSQIKEGMIVDSQDYLDNWYLAIVCKVQPKNE